MQRAWKTTRRRVINRVILGIDPGLAHLGWGSISIKDNRLASFKEGSINTYPSKTTGERLIYLEKELTDVLARVAPDEAAIEGMTYGRWSTGTVPVAKAVGVIERLLAARGIPLVDYNITTVKRQVAGTGLATKADIESCLRILLETSRDYKFSSNHASDALAIAITHQLLRK